MRYAVALAAALLIAVGFLPFFIGAYLLHVAFTITGKKLTCKIGA